MKVKFRFDILAMIALGLGALACSLIAPALPTPSAAPELLATSNASPPAATPGTSDPQQTVRDAFVKLDVAYPYRLTETDSALICSRQLTTTEYAAHDAWHAVWSGCVSGEAIASGGTTYYLANGSWSTTGVPPPGADQVARIPNLAKTALRNVRSLGSAALNGLNTSVYEFDLDDPVLNVKGGKVWIGAADGLPHQVQVSFSISGFGVNTTLVYEYGVPVTIKAPIP